MSFRDDYYELRRAARSRDVRLMYWLAERNIYTLFRVVGESLEEPYEKYPLSVRLSRYRSWGELVPKRFRA